MSDGTLADRNYYCSMKFRQIKIDLESQTSYTCHASSPHPVNIEWLSKNPGELFNHSVNIQERQMMLDNQRAPSCEQNCWYAEDRGLTSPRLDQQGPARTHTELLNTPEIIDLTVGADCNLTCSYCCKEFSSAWRRDIAQNGSYELTDLTNQRYRLSMQDRLLMKIKQTELGKSKKYNLLLNEVKLASPTLQRLEVSGGEPFLHNQLIDLIGDLDLSDHAEVNIYSGLGVDPTRFKRMISRLANNSKIKIFVSAECIGSHLEFNRYGITWEQFQQNLNAIRDAGVKFCFHSVLTNLTSFGFKDFCDYFAGDEIVTTYAYQPRMMNLSVMDEETKAELILQFSTMSSQFRTQLIDNIKATPSETERNDLSNFLKTFASRRNLNLGIYPKSFLDWLNIKNVV